MCDEPSQLHCSTGYMEGWSAVDGALASRGNHGNSNKIQQSENYSLGVTQAVLRYGVSAYRTEPRSLALTRRVLAFSQRLSSPQKKKTVVLVRWGACAGLSNGSGRSDPSVVCRRGWACSTSDSSALQARRGGRSPRTLGCLSLVGRAAPL